MPRELQATSRQLRLPDSGRLAEGPPRPIDAAARCAQCSVCGRQPHLFAKCFRCSNQTAAERRVQIKYLSAVRDVTDRPEDEVAFPPGATLCHVAAWLDERYDLAVSGPGVMAVLNGRGWEQLRQKLATELQDGDAVAFFPPIARG